MDRGTSATETSETMRNALRSAAHMLAALCCVMAIWPVAPAAAQSPDPVRCKYESRSDVTTPLRLMRTGDEAARLAAAAALVQVGKDALPVLMAAIPESLRPNAES